MTNTALGAKTFKDEAHEDFYKEYLEKCRYQNVYHKALVCCLGISEDTRKNAERIIALKQDTFRRSV